MFVGHFGVALAAKKVAPRPSLGTLTLAALLADGVSAIFLLLGWEKVEIHPGITAVSPLEFVSYPYSHSLVAGVFWAALIAAAYYLARRDRNGALWLAALVLSHWILDFISHGPDMPVGLDGPMLGLGLWYSAPATIVVEYGLLALGAWVYASVTRPRDRTGSWALWIYVATLGIVYLATMVGPPPPSVRALAIAGLFGWLFVAWAYWIDRHRAIITG